MSEPQPGPLGALVIGYLDRVVNRRDISAVDELVAAGYRGSGPGWPDTIDDLRRFHLEQYRDRPDWHIDVDTAVELGDRVVVRARAHGTVTEDGQARTRAARWLAHYRVADARIHEIDVLVVEPVRGREE
jgi:predicted SnoaL-like aldol condensation-catalyzing enzyme